MIETKDGILGQAEAVAAEAERANERRERREAIHAAMRTWVDCIGCGQPFKGMGLTCRACEFLPGGSLVDEL